MATLYKQVMNNRESGENIARIITFIVVIANDAWNAGICSQTNALQENERVIMKQCKKKWNIPQKSFFFFSDENSQLFFSFN